MSSLALPKPDNLRVPDHGRAHLVEADVYHICDRIKELDPNLYVYLLDPPVCFGERTYRYSVTEFCADRVERLVRRYEELDARVIENLEYMLRVPFEHRLQAAEATEAQNDAARKEQDFERLYEQVGAPMRRDLERCGFASRNTSYAKRGVRFR